MKFLLIIAIVFLVLWLTSSRRHDVQGRADAARQAKPAPQPMVACARCGVHLPRTEAIAGRDGLWFCGDEHRLAFERGDPS